MLGTLQYLSVATRPDITYVVSVLACFSQNPGITHWNGVKRVYAYLKGTHDFWLGSHMEQVERVLGYSDADGMSQEDRHAISGYVFMLNGGAISWLSKRQDTISLSTMEAEYIALTHAAKEAIWLKNLISELFGSITTPILILADNQSAIALAKDDRFHAHTKHIDIRYHFICYIIEEGNIRLTYCPTEDMTADIFTKALPSVKAKHFAASMGLAKV